MQGDLIGYKDPVSLSVWLAILPVILPILAATIVLFLRDNPSRQPGVAVATMALNFIIHIALLIKVNLGGPFSVAMGSWPATKTVPLSAPAVEIIAPTATRLLPQGPSIEAASANGDVDSASWLAGTNDITASVDPT